VPTSSRSEYDLVGRPRLPWRPSLYLVVTPCQPTAPSGRPFSEFETSPAPYSKRESNLAGDRIRKSLPHNTSHLRDGVGVVPKIQRQRAQNAYFRLPDGRPSPEDRPGAAAWPTPQVLAPKAPRVRKGALSATATNPRRERFDGEGLVEAGGIEPPSRGHSTMVSTSVVRLLNLTP